MPKLKPIPLPNFLSKWRLPLCTQMPKLGFWASTFTPSSQTLPRPVDLIPDLSPPSALNRSTVTAPVPSPSLDVLNPLHSQPQWCFFNSFFCSLSPWGWSPKPSVFYDLAHYSPPYIILLVFEVLAGSSMYFHAFSCLWAFALCLKYHLSYIFCFYFLYRTYWGCHPCKGAFPHAPCHHPGLD